MRKLVGVMCVIAVLGSLAGCGKSGDDDDSSTSGSGGAAIGTGGASAGTGGMAAGTGGMTAGSGGAAGMPGMGGGMDCASADLSAGGPALHAAAAEVLAVMSPCGFGGCHVGTNPAAKLLLTGATDLRATLVDKVSCEAPNMKLIDGSSGDAAVANSWLWIKLTSPATDTAGITASPADETKWGPTGVCGQQPGLKYGQRMPATQAATETLSEARLSKIRNWICAGAPGPQ
jgi:hypothetical protein